MLTIGQSTRSQGLHNVNICLCLIGHALDSVKLQNVCYLQRHGVSNQWCTLKQFFLGMGKLEGAEF